MFVPHDKISNRDFSIFPLLWISVCFAAGILFSGQFSTGWRLSLLVAVLSAVFSAICRARIIATSVILFAFVAAGVFYSESTKVATSLPTIKDLFESGVLRSGDPIEVEGSVAGAPESASGGFFLIITAEAIIVNGETRGAAGTLRLFAAVNELRLQREYDELDLVHGARFRIGCRLKREERYRNPGSVSWISVLDQKNLDATASINSPLLIEPLDHQNVSVVRYLIHNYRAALIEQIISNFNPSTAGMLAASTLGNRNYLTKESGEIFRAGGTYHILIISGLHITFIGGAIFFILGRITNNRFARFLSTIAGLWVYSFAVGAEIPVIRAALMFTVWLLSTVIYRRSSSRNTLGACLLLMLIWEPSSLYSLSFQLTFVSIAGIVMIAFPLLSSLRSIGLWSPCPETPLPPKVTKAIRVFCECIYWSEREWIKTLGENVWHCRIFKSAYAGGLERIGLQRPIRWLFEGIVVSAVVQLALLPFLIHDFHRISFASVFLNLWVGPLAVLQCLFALISLTVLQLSDYLAFPMIRITELTNALLISPAAFVTGHELTSSRVPVYSGRLSLIYAAYFLPVIFFQLIIHKWDPFESVSTSEKQTIRDWAYLCRLANGIAVSLFAVLFFVVVFHPFSAPAANGKLTVDFLDVGQGDSSLLTFPNGETMLIDGGGEPSYRINVPENSGRPPRVFQPDRAGVGESVVSEFLWEKGYSKVDYIVATHADNDHIKGLIDVAKNFRVGAALIRNSTSPSETFAEFIEVLERRNIGRLKVIRGDKLNIGGVDIDIIHPPGISNDSENNSSIVLMITFGSRRFMFTGDIEMQAEAALTRSSGSIRSDVVKVPHHGSRTSSKSEFVEATGAKFAIISVRRNSQFGHPHAEVVERWRKMGAKVLTTGERGTITISTDGKNLDVQTYINPVSMKN